MVRGAALAHAIGALVGFAVVWLTAGLGAGERPLDGNASVPILDFLCRQLANQGGAERGRIWVSAARRV